MRTFLVALCLVAFPVLSAETPFTNDDVIALVKAGIDDAVVLAKINQAEQIAFDTSTDALVKLKAAGVSNAVLEAIIERSDGTSVRSGGSAAGAVETGEGPIEPLPSGETTQRQSRVGKATGLLVGRRTVDSSDSCPEPGSGVEFIRLASPGTAPDFAGCDVTTLVEFVGIGTGNFIVSGIPKDYVVFRAVSPGAVAEKNPLSGEPMTEYIAVPKSKADVVFALRPGARVRVRGATRLNKVIFGGSFQQVVFLASNVAPH